MRLFATICSALALAGSLAAEPPFYRAAHTLDTITVDGRLDELTWDALPRVERFVDIRRPDAADSAYTRATMAWDDRAFYFAFVALDDTPWNKMLERDAHLWEQEVVEVFLDPDGDGRDYAELEVSPHNVVVDLLIPAPGAVPADEAAKWNIAGLETAVVKQARGWTVEIAIPWAALEAAGVDGKPKIGDRWRVGLYRIERPLDAPQNAELMAWSPTERNFHEPDKFGVVEFVIRP